MEPERAVPAATPHAWIADALARVGRTRVATRVARRLDALATALVVGVALVPAARHLGAIALVFARRLRYPADLEWMEGALLYQAERMRLGMPVYDVDGTTFTPLPYPPAFHALVALLGRLGGVGYGVGRGVSVVAFVVAIAIAARELTICARRRLHGRVAAVVAVAAIAAGFPAVGGWFDLCRTDTLAIALPMLAAWLARPETAGRRRLVAVAAVLVASVFAKQTSLAFAAWIVAWWTLQRPRAGLALAGIAVAMGGAVLAALQLATHGRYWFWTVTVPLRIGGDPARARAAMRTLLDFFPYALAIAPLSLGLASRRVLGPRAWLWIGMAAAAIPASIKPYMAPGGYVNVFVPAIVLVPVAAAFVALELLNHLPDGEAAHRAVALGLLAYASGWLDARAWDPQRFVPSDAQRAAAERLDRLGRELDGGLFVPWSPFLGARHRPETPQVHAWAVHDALETRAATFDWSAYLRDLDARWALVCDRPPGLERYYVFDRKVTHEPTTVTGLALRCEDLWRRREPARPVERAARAE